MIAMRPRLVIAVLLPLAAAGCTLTPPEEDPTYLKQVEIDNRLARVERVVDNQGLMNLLAELETLRKDNQALRNEVETLRNTVEQGGERQRQLYLDVDQRLQGIEQRTTAIARADAEKPVLDGGSLSPGELPVPGGGARANYQAAFELLKQGRYDQASLAFRQFLAAFPDSNLSDNAQYWLAESYYVRQKYKEALPEFEKVVSKFPQSRKIPDALLKIGYINYELKRYDAARKALSSVVQEYKETTAARLAGQRLEAMASEGH
ncbi:MAG: tol-pal system protein YbgF [Gammaproteobacteria bacterium]|nr:MAG: tol-pal system protein YbgF [Gammaproteobacteria bacterium]